MDKICGVIDAKQVITSLRAEGRLLPENLLIILGPTASGKTKFAVSCAKLLDGEIISADSRQVYRGMDIGTGKDLHEFGPIPYHLIDIVDPGEKYNIHRFIQDFEQAHREIIRRGKRPIVCGGTGFYIQSLIAPQPYTQVPVNEAFRQEMERHDKSDIRVLFDQTILPPGFSVDYSSKKRMIRALEIAEWTQRNPDYIFPPLPAYPATIIGLHPTPSTRRSRISNRLHHRLSAGMIAEVQQLLDTGLTYEELEYYGLEYKYTSLFLQERLSYEQFVAKLETEIHRYAKRQMTYFRKMEKDGATIHWIHT